MPEPGQPMSDEQKAKLSDIAKRNWEKRKAQAQGYQEAPIVGVSSHSTRQQLDDEAARAGRILVTESTLREPDKWWDLPFEAALAELMKLEKELKHAREVISSRSTILPKTWTCWVALNREAYADLPGMGTAYRECKKTIPDGKWNFKDDCNIDPSTGLIDPQVTCSDKCHLVYQIFRNRQKQKARLAGKL